MPTSPACLQHRSKTTGDSSICYNFDCSYAGPPDAKARDTGTAATYSGQRLQPCSRRRITINARHEDLEHGFLTNEQHDAHSANSFPTPLFQDELHSFFIILFIFSPAFAPSACDCRHPLSGSALTWQVWEQAHDRVGIGATLLLHRRRDACGYQARPQPNNECLMNSSTTRRTCLFALDHIILLCRDISTQVAFWQLLIPSAPRLNEKETHGM